LTGAARVYLDQSAPSVFSFVRNLKDQSSPTGIVHRLGQHSTGHALDLQILDHDGSVILDQPEREAMLKVVSLIPDSSVNLLQQHHGFTTPMRTFLATGDFALGTPEASLALLIPSRIGNRRAIGKGRQILQTQVNPNCSIERRQWLGFALNRKTDVPLAAFAFHGNRLNCAGHRAVQLHFHWTDALHPKYVAMQPHSISIAGKSDAVETAAGFESGIASFFPSLHPAKERLKGLVDSTKNILAAGEIRQTQVPPARISFSCLAWS
jgi:hypothetical protein